MILVTGGCRSGKSEFAEKLAQEKGNHVLYFATAIPFDDEMQERIRKHQIRRPSEWETHEGYLGLPEVIRKKSMEYDCMLFDCITVWITNLMFSFSTTTDVEQMDYHLLELEILEEAKKIVKALKEQSTEMIFVTNEVGLGIVPENKLSRHFRDIAGKVNQYLAQNSDEVYFVVSGIPLKIKGGKE